jgi:hypothetical protein
MKCLICGTLMDPVNESHGTHPACDMKLLAVDEGEDPFTSLLRGQLISMVRWAEQQNPRSKQQMIGPSEVGSLCDRRIGYRLAEIPRCNTDFDPWPSIVGTAIHSWLDDAVSNWMTCHGSTAWSTETTLVINDFVEGHADLYSHEHRSVIDYKTVGPDVMKKIRRDGPPLGYQIQTHVYGYGFEQQGHQVDRVCLVFLPRAGWFKDMFIWSSIYNREIAVVAMTRLQVIAQQILKLDTLTYPNKWNDVEAVPSNECGFCPWYNPGRENHGADDQGCPGR